MPSGILPAEGAAPATCCSLFFLDFRAHLGVCGETDAQHGLATPVRSYSWRHLSSQLQAKCSRPIPKEVPEETTELPQLLGAEGRRSTDKELQSSMSRAEPAAGPGKFRSAGSPETTQPLPPSHVQLQCLPVSGN